MKIFLAGILLIFTCTCFSQTRPGWTLFAQIQYNHTLYDQNFYYKTAKGGLSLQVFTNTTHKLAPTAEVNADIVSQTGLGPADEPINRESVIPGIYAGLCYRAGNRLFISATAGPSSYAYAYKRQVHFGIRPSVSFNPGHSQRWFVKASYTNVFQAYQKDFGYLSLALGFKL